MPDREVLDAERIDPKDDASHSPSGYLHVTLTQEQREQLEPWLMRHFEQITEAMQPVLSRFDEEVNQFEGLMPGGDYPYPGFFRINVPITKKKVREIANRLKQAYLDSDPIWAITSEELTTALAQSVEKGLDAQVDHHLDLVDDVAQALFESVLHGVGCLEPGWAYHEDVRRDVAVYQGFDGVNAETLADLARFELDFPNWRDDPESRKLHTKLANGDDLSHEIEYRTATVNRPDAVHIPAKDLRLYPHLNSSVEVQFSPAYGYVKTHRRSELEDLATDGMIDEDQLGRIFGDNKRGKDATPSEQMDEYEVFHCTIRYRLGEDQVPTRYKVWYETDSHVILRIREYPWWLDEPDLIFFHTRQEEPGIFKRGIAWDLKDTHTAANATFSLFLNGADRANAFNLKTKQNSPAEHQVLQRRYSPHLPLVWKNDPNEVEVMQSQTGQLTSLVNAFELVRRQSDEDTQTSSLQSGRESPTDPNAPGNKTAMLLQQVEPNMKECIRSLEPGFRLLGKWMLWLFYQGKRLEWIDEVPGLQDVPDEMLPEIAKSLNPRAILFEYDRQNRLQADNMVLGWVSKLAPQAAPQVLRKAISHVNSDWAKEVDSLPLDAPMPMAPPGQAPAPTGANRLQGLVNGQGHQTAPSNPMANLVPS